MPDRPAAYEDSGAQMFPEDDQPTHLLPPVVEDHPAGAPEGRRRGRRAAGGRHGRGRSAGGRLGAGLVISGAAAVTAIGLGAYLLTGPDGTVAAPVAAGASAPALPTGPTTADPAAPTAGASPSAATAAPADTASAAPTAAVSPTAAAPTTAAPAPSAPARSVPTKPAAAPTADAPKPGGPAVGTAAEFARQVVDLTNAERAKAGCGPLQADSRLQAAAQGHADDMAARNYYEHSSPEGRHADDRMRAAGYPVGAWGENIHRSPRDAAAAVRDWMNSPAHRENILNCAYKHLGVGVNMSANGPWWVQNFGSPR
ncbi:CAP domain-containing protein [Kitasatospora camelliae]|uniref:CAP domain-containing protein n=1 Tax=Kitasatospora camelliae TaxID=3156397 RepID=A0AAU8K4W6_9ACTN